MGMGILGQGGYEWLKPFSFYVSSLQSLSWLSQMLPSLALSKPSSWSFSGSVFPLYFWDFGCAKLSPQPILVMLSRGTPVAFALAQFSIENGFGQSHVLHVRRWPAQCSCLVRSMDSILVMSACSRTSLLVIKSCHLMLMMEWRHCWWKHSRSCTCFPGLGTEKESGDHCCSVDQDLCCEVQRVILPYTYITD